MKNNCVSVLAGEHPASVRNLDQSQTLRHHCQTDEIMNAKMLSARTELETKHTFQTMEIPNRISCVEAHDIQIAEID